MFCWIPGHIDIKDNEKVDRAAKAALNLEVEDLSLPYSDFALTYASISGPSGSCSGTPRQEISCMKFIRRLVFGSHLCCFPAKIKFF